MLLCGICVSLLGACGKQEEELKDSLVDTEQEEKRDASIVRGAYSQR